ncbi:proline racemase family protein [Aliikangiella maris]|uniref:Proline racemase family protein n=2 Tax=Aliikangiella maris TaxID=3162458 RepID=A0ABV2BXA4_9GAMM
MSDFFQRFTTRQTYTKQAQQLAIQSIDMHTGGEPLRVILSGYPQIKASSLLDYREVLQADYDHLRTALMFEPRGHADMYGCLILPPFNPKADCSAIFMHNEGYSNMCGHAVIAIMTLAMQMQWVEITDNRASMTIEAPCGLISASGVIENGKINASFECVPSFVTTLNQSIQIPGTAQTIEYDIAFGGAFYAYVDAAKLSMPLTPDNTQQIIQMGRAIKQAVKQSPQFLNHPFETRLNELYGTIFIAPVESSQIHSRNVCIFADGELDRSPTGSGVSGRVAILAAKGELQVNQPIVIESLIGSSFTVEIIKIQGYGDYQAVIPKVTGNAYVCGKNEWIIDAKDPFAQGFLLR